MTTRDIMNSVDLEQVVAPQSTSAEVVGSAVDMQGYDSLGFAALTGTISSDVHNMVIEESDDNSTWTEPEADHVQGAVSTALNAENSVFEVGYIGYKRYVRARIDGAGGTALVGVTAVKGHKHVQQGKF